MRNKTPYMQYLELKHVEPIEALITKGTTRQVAKRLGVSHVTVWKWLRVLELESVKEKTEQTFTLVGMDT